MKPEEILNTDSLPEDLHWLAAEYRLQPNDPVYLLIAWHWTRIQKGEDSLRSATMEMKAAVDSRVASVVGTAETLLALQEQLRAVQETLDQKPAALGRQLELELKRPVSLAVNQIALASVTCNELVARTGVALNALNNRMALAALLIGYVLGGGSAVLLFLPQ